MQLDLMNKISNKLDNIKELLNLEDAYYINDTIISNIKDQDLPKLVQEIMDVNGYYNKKIKKVLKIVIDIQNDINNAE